MGGPPPAQVGSMISLAAVEREHIRRVVEASSSVRAAARVLGIDAATIYRKRRGAEGGAAGAGN